MKFHLHRKIMTLRSHEVKSKEENKLQDKIFRRKSLSTDANFVRVYIETWDKGVLKFNIFSMQQVKKRKQCDSLIFAFIKFYKIS